MSVLCINIFMLFLVTSLEASKSDSPGPAKLQVTPSVVVKGNSVILTCTTDFTDHPNNVSYIWYRGSQVLSNVTGSIYIIRSAGLDTRNNFSCRAVNDRGLGEPAFVFLNVFAPPTFIKRLPSYQGILSTSKNVMLTCIVECYPNCNIVWRKDGIKLQIEDNPLYTVETQYMPSNVEKNDFESVNSSLIWNISSWPGQILQKNSPNTNYSCEAASNKIGHLITSTVEIAVEYPPEEITVGTILVNIKEGEIPNVVRCDGKGKPSLSFRWENNEGNVISYGDILRLPKLTRTNAGKYTCEASNKHGSKKASVYFNIQYVPECTITMVEKNGTPALVCTATANPKDMTFTWIVQKDSNIFIEKNNIVQEQDKSYLLLDPSDKTFRTYKCTANNTIGASNPCTIEVPNSKQ